jgi:hypothetical protein
MTRNPFAGAVGGSRTWLLLLLVATLAVAATLAPRAARASAFPPETVAQAQSSPSSSTAPDSASSNGTDLAPRLREARDCLKNGDYERAIDLLRTAIERARNRLPELQDAYLLLIKTYVLRGNEYKLDIQGRTTSELYYQYARQEIVKCLGTRELRHTQPVPVSEYPPEMVDLFAKVRREIFGSLRVVDLTPLDATVLCDADTLRAPLTDSLPGDTDISVGPHLMVVRRIGYRDLTEEVHISPGSVLELRFRLEEKHGAGWYALRGGVLSGAIGGAAWAILAGKDKTATGLQELPGPPPPPQ